MISLSRTIAPVISRAQLLQERFRRNRAPNISPTPKEAITIKHRDTKEVVKPRIPTKCTVPAVFNPFFTSVLLHNPQGSMGNTQADSRAPPRHAKPQKRNHGEPAGRQPNDHHQRRTNGPSGHILALRAKDRRTSTWSECIHPLGS